MPDLRAITSVAIDVAGHETDEARQDALGDLIWHLLERNYQILLVSSTPGTNLAADDFQHKALHLVGDPLPPGAATLKEFPALNSARTLWVTDDNALQEWLRAAKFSFAYTTGPGEARSGEIKVTALTEVAALLDPTTFAFQEVVAWVAPRRAEKAGRPFLLGVGGPPLSGFQAFAVDLKRSLEEAGHPLVELLDFSALLEAATEGEPAQAAATEPWASESAATFARTQILDPLRTGERIFLERLPEGVPAEFEAHLPLFVSEDAVVILLGERLFIPPVRDALDGAILLEVTPAEITRRLYMIEEEGFEPKFTEQYLTHDGSFYRDYLERYQVAAGADLRIDANAPHAFKLRPHGDRTR